MENNSKSGGEKNYQDYFENYAAEVSEEYLADKKSQKEQDEFFQGSLTDINTWLQHEEFRLKKANQDSERTLREKNARLAFQFSSVWAVFIAIIILLKGFVTVTFFILSEVEFLFIIGTLTASIFAFYLLVLKYLFYIKPAKKAI